MVTEFVVEAAERVHGRRVRRLEISPLTSSTSYHTSSVTVEFADGNQVRLFLKDFTSSMRPKIDPDARRQCEMSFYTDVAPNGELGVARLYGATSDPNRGLHCLLLEFVAGTPVRYCPFEEWVRAAGWLGRMHAFFWHRPHLWQHLDFLERHSQDNFVEMTQKALAAVAAISIDLGRRLETLLDDLVAVTSEMLRPPRTLLHGGYRAMNVLTLIEGDAERLCVTDWEEAAIGSGFADLSFFVRGFPDDQRDRLLEAYYEASTAQGMPLPDRDTAARVIGIFTVFNAIRSLPKYANWHDAEQTTEKLVTHAEGLARAVAWT